MQKVTKNIILLSVIGIVLFQTLIDILNFYTIEISELRRNRILDGEYIVKTKILSLKEWDNFDSKKEIKINGIHFDVINYVIKNNKVIVKGFEDNFEDELNFIFKKTKDSKNKNYPTKKKLLKQHYIFSKLLILGTKKIIDKKQHFNKIHVLKSIGKTKKTESRNFKPPCLIS